MKKNIPRIFIQDNLFINQFLDLSQENTHYIKNVLRMKQGDILEIFNNTNYIFLSEIIYISKKTIKVKIFNNQFKNIESPLHIHLGQVILKNKKMDFTIQKSIEMGVNIITPLFSEYCNGQEKNINFSNNIRRWKKIAISACSQCNRNILPKINKPKDISSWCDDNSMNDFNIILHPQSILTMNDLPKSIKSIKIIIGPEGGLSNSEIHNITQKKFVAIRLGPRILRTETAALSAITALQIKFGDFMS